MDCLGATLVAAISQSGSSKSVVLPIIGEVTHSSQVTKECQEKALHLWVLNTRVTYTSTGCIDARTAIKVLFKVLDKDEAEKLAESVTEDVQDIRLAPEALRDCIGCLYESNKLLPCEQQMYQEWKVGLLDRHDS